MPTKPAACGGGGGDNAHEARLRMHVRFRKGPGKMEQGVFIQAGSQHVLPGVQQVAGYFFNLDGRLARSVDYLRASRAFQAVVVDVRVGKCGGRRSPDLFRRLFRGKAAFLKLAQDGGDVVHDGLFMLPREYPSRSRVM